MCFQSIPVLSQPRSKNTRRRQRNPANLRPIATSSTTPLSFSVGLWNCQSAVNKADFISAFSLQSTLSILGLTETWIRPEDSATPAALSQFLFLSHPKASWPGWGHWSAHFKQLEILNPLSPRQSQLIWISCDYCNGSYKTPDSIIYRPPGQILATFLEELDGLLSSFMEDGTPLLVFGDFNIHLDRPYATDFHSLLASFDLKRLTTTSTHKSGNQLDLITHATVLQITFWYNHYISLTISSLHLPYILLPRCHQLPYRLLSDVTYAPFPPPFFPL